MLSFNFDAVHKDASLKSLTTDDNTFNYFVIDEKAIYVHIDSPWLSASKPQWIIHINEETGRWELVIGVDSVNPQIYKQSCKCR